MALPVEEEVQITSAAPDVSRFSIPAVFDDEISFEDAEHRLRFDKHISDEQPLSLEDRFARLQAHDGRKTLIVGAGNAGINCALEALERGEFVVLLDASNLPGGLGASVGSANNGGLSAIEKPKKRREVAIEAIQVLEHPNVLFLPEIKMDVTALDALGFDGIVIATGGKENTDKKLLYTHPSIFSSKQWIESAHSSLDTIGEAADPDQLPNGKRIARNPDGTLAPVLIIGGGNIAILDAPRHAIGIRLRDALIRLQGDTPANRRLDIEKAIHGAGALDMADKLGIPREELQGGAIIVYRNKKALMRPMEPQEKYVQKYMEPAFAEIQKRNTALGEEKDMRIVALSLDRLDAPVFADIKSEVERIASDIARNTDEEFQKVVIRNVDIATVKQGVEVKESMVIESVTEMKDGTGRLKVILKHTDGTEGTEEVIAGALVTAIGFLHGDVPEGFETPVVGAGMVEDGRGNLDASAKGAKRSMNLLRALTDQNRQTGSREIRSDVLELMIQQTKLSGFDGNIIRRYLEQGPRYFIRSMWLRSGDYDGRNNKPPDIKEVTGHIAIHQN